MLACLFAVGGHDPPLLARRIESLSAFYAPLGATPERSAFHTADTDGAGVGWIAFTPEEAARLERSWRETGTASWGEAPPAETLAALAAPTATDADLRRLHPFGAHFARNDRGVRVVTGPGPPTALYAAEGTYATHAVACAWLATGSVELDGERVPELAALGFVGGEETLVRGVRAVAPATVAGLGAPPGRSRTYWPARERWATLPEREAGAAAEAALLASLADRVPAGATLGLTAGLDSLVVGAALRRLGLRVPAYTWDLAPADAAGGAQAAARLGLDHATEPLVVAEPGAALQRARVEARWTEGMGLTSGFGAVRWPEGTSAVLTGAGGETGRAFYWRLQAANHAEPSPAQLARALRPDLRIADAHEAARAAVRARAAAFIEDAAAHGARGWRVLDVLYAEQRMARWGRGTLARHAAVPVHAFTPPAVARALVSLPDRARARDGFHRAFLRRHAPDLSAAPAPPLQRRGIPRAVRRRVAARRLARAPQQGGAWPLRTLWPAQPEYRAWLEDAVLAGTLVQRSLGPGWADRVAAGVRAGDSWSTEAAIAVSGAVALQDALAGLRAT